MWSIAMLSRTILIACLTKIVCFGVLSQAAYSGEKIVLFAGGSEATLDIPAVRAQLREPFGIAFDCAGAAYVVELSGHRLLKIENGILTQVAGTGKKGKASDGTWPGLHAEFNGLHNLAIGPSGEVFLADTWNQQVRLYDSNSGQVTIFAGTGASAFAGDGGLAANAQFGGIYCVTLAGDQQRLIVADLDNRRVRAIDLKSTMVTTLAGNGRRGVPADDFIAVESPLVDPRAVTADKDGNVYLLERGGHALRLINREGRIRTVVGTGIPGLS
jgi:hypothetical protein